jgi:hypothetical protein
MLPPGSSAAPPVSSPPARRPRSSLLLLLFFLCSCVQKLPVTFPAGGAGLGVYGRGAEAAEGVLDLSRPKTWRFTFDRPRSFTAESLKIAYAFSAPPADEFKERFQLVLRAGEGEAWVLPWDASFLVPGEELGAYSLPLSGSALEGFSLSLAPAGEGAGKKGPAAPRLILKSLDFEPVWYGVIRNAAGISATPFVYRETGGGLGIRPPADRRIRDAELRVIRREAAPGGLTLELSGPVPEGQGGGHVYEAAPELRRFRIPAAILDKQAGAAISLRGSEIEAFYLAAGEAPPFPQPLPADPGLILEYPQARWRDRRYEIFRWEQFPSVLIFDTADYAVQDSLFKRLCFFVEKKGFRGRVLADGEMAELHGWNAHDYRAEDLARFFQAAADFSLSPEERELERILLREGLIRQAEGRTGAGEGAVLSISRESTPYLRGLFMNHEGFHGLFFIDREFRDFSRRRWDGLSPPARTFILSYFDYQSYDTADAYLMVNELMAHCLQQPVSQTPRYFGEILPSRLESSPRRRAALPARDEVSGHWSEFGRAFQAEAEAFSAYAGRRWGLSAGRAWHLASRQDF